MIGIAAGLVQAAEQAGIEIPSDPEDYERDSYPRWHVYCTMQLGASMPHPHAHFDNAKMIAALSEDELKTITPAELVRRGFSIGVSEPAEPEHSHPHMPKEFKVLQWAWDKYFSVEEFDQKRLASHGLSRSEVLSMFQEVGIDGSPDDPENADLGAVSGWTLSHAHYTVVRGIEAPKDMRSLYTLMWSSFKAVGLSVPPLPSPRAVKIKEEYTSFGKRKGMDSK